MTESTTCRDCGARVIWVATQNDKRMPLDHEPERRYVLESATAPMKARLRNAYSCHFDTCKKRKT